MIFGNVSTFAIEAMSEPDLQPPSAVWGRLRVWCENQAIGNYTESYSALYGSYNGLKTLKENLNNLWLDEFANLSNQELWNLLDGALYGYHGEIELHDIQRYNRFNFLTNWGEQFDNCGKSFIFCTPSKTVRILNRLLPEARGIALEATQTNVVLAINGFMTWFESEVVRLRSS